MTRARDLSRLSNSNAFSVDSLNRIGIGSTTPRADLDVIGNVLIGDDISIQSGIVTATTFSGNITGVAATFTGNVSIAGTLTYEDVTNIDSVGLITARSGVVLTGGDITLGTGVTASGTTANTFTVSTNGSERVRVDSSGNINVDSGGVYYDASNNRLGVGTTSPNQLLQVNGSGVDARIQLTNSASGSTNSDGFHLQFNSSDIFFDNKESGNFIFQSGATEAARIDSSRRLLVGTLSARSDFYNASTVAPVFQVQGTGNNRIASITAVDTASASGPVFILAKSRSTGNTVVISGDYLGEVSFQGSDGSEIVEGASIAAVVDATPGANNLPTRLMFSTNVGSPDTSPTERMRITAQGFLKASNTGSYSTPTSGFAATQHEITNSTDARDIIQLYQTHASNPYGIFQRFSNATPNNATNYFHYCMDNTTVRVVLRSNGGIANYQSNNANLCDEREKKNIETLDSTWGCLKNWELKKFHYNEDNDADDKRYGVIAQQVQTVCPEVITDWIKQKAEDAVLDEDGNVVTPAKEEITRMGVKEQQMMWMAIKALQEAQDRIETLEAKVAALETP